MKRFIVYIVVFLLSTLSVSAEKFRWLYDIVFEAPERSRVMYNSRDRLEMIIEDLTFVIQVYSNDGVDDEILKLNLRRRATE